MQRRVVCVDLLVHGYRDAMLRMVPDALIGACELVKRFHPRTINNALYGTPVLIDCHQVEKIEPPRRTHASAKVEFFAKYGRWPSQAEAEAFDKTVTRKPILKGDRSVLNKHSLIGKNNSYVRSIVPFFPKSRLFGLSKTDPLPPLRTQSSRPTAIGQRCKSGGETATLQKSRNFLLRKQRAAGQNLLPGDPGRGLVLRRNFSRRWRFRIFRGR